MWCYKLQNKKQIHIQKLKQNTEIVKTKIENRENRKHTDFLSKPSPHTWNAHCSQHEHVMKCKQRDNI